MFLNNKQYKYPKYWDDDDIIRFKYYLKEAKEMFDLPDDMIELCVVRQINEEKGLLKPFDYSQVKEMKITTPIFEEFKTVIDIENEIDIDNKIDNKIDNIIEIEA
jgi:hypothetical protein